MLHRHNQENDSVITDTSREQTKTENKIMQYIYPYRQKQAQLFYSVPLNRDQHVQYCLRGLESLSSSFESLDASRPWLCYWILHALDLLGHQLPPDMCSRVVDFIGRRCQDPDGGFGGGPGQLPHLAPTYASVLSLCIVNTKESLEVIDRTKLRRFLISLKDPKTKGFRMHQDGEVDTRGAYTALAVASLLNIMDEEVTQGVDEYIISCQTYEGGIGSLVGNEAHGGYTFCGLAAMMLLKKSHLLHVESLVHWSARRQMDYEGGFQGRTNKLVDACYSFWLGGIFPLLRATIAVLSDDEDKQIFEHIKWSPPENIETKKDLTSFYHSPPMIETNSFSFCSVQIEEEEGDTENEHFPELQGDWFFDESALQEYLLLCAQDDKGGMRDKPGKSRDYYHTCYALSGLSVAQHHVSGEVTVLGDPNNLLRPTNAIINICCDKVEAVLKHFGDRTTL